MNDTPPMRQIVLGGGCFWCTEAVFKEVRGILDVESGYANGHLDRPSYDDVCSGETGHNEVVKLTFADPFGQCCLGKPHRLSAVL